LKKSRLSKKFIYLISPNKIKDELFFYSNLRKILKTKKIEIEDTKDGTIWRSIEKN